MLSKQVNDKLRMEMGAIALAQVDTDGTRTTDTDGNYLFILDAFGNQQFNTEITPIVLLDINLTTGGGALKYTTAPYDFVDGNNGTYSANGTILELTPPRAEGIVDRDIFSFTLADVGFALKSRFETESTGVSVEIRVKLIDSDLQVIPGNLGVFKGNISAVRFYNEGDNEFPEPRIDITCTGPLAKLQQVTERVTTETSQKASHPNDTCFDRSFNTENQTNLRWGGG